MLLFFIHRFNLFLPNSGLNVFTQLKPMKRVIIHHVLILNFKTDNSHMNAYYSTVIKQHKNN